MTPAEHLAAALAGMGFSGDPEMTQTHRQFTQMLQGFLPAERAPVVSLLPTRSSDLIILRGLPFHSLCAHHLLPFFGTCTLAYRPSGSIAGLGWFPRLLHHLAHRPQLQERLADQLIETIMDALSPTSAGVVIQARQLCVEMRGACSPGEFEVRAQRGAEDPELLQALAQ